MSTKVLGATRIGVNQCLEGVVSKVDNGDTIFIKNGDKIAEVRMDRIDAPEVGQEHGDVALKALSKKIRGKKVSVEWKKRDPSGRVLGVVKLGGEDVNLWMVKEGHAWHYSYFDKTPEYAEAQKSAQAAGLGLWAAEHPVHPYDWRKSKQKPCGRW